MAFRQCSVKVGKDVAASVGIYILIVDGDFYKTEYARWLYDMDFFTLGILLFLIIGLFVWL